MQTDVLKVIGMTCGGCTSSVTRVLRGVPGVTNVAVSLEAGSATIEYDEQRATRAQLASAVVGAGFGVDGVDGS